MAPAIRVAVVTDAGGDVTQRLIAELRRLDSFDIVEASRRDGDHLWRAGQVHAVVSVQDQADVTLASGHAASVQVVYDASKHQN